VASSDGRERTVINGRVGRRVDLPVNPRRQRNAVP
jgi:hypothetical protein